LFAGLPGFGCGPWDQNLPLWSLGYEWALYLFAPAIIKLAVWEAAPCLRLLAVLLVCAIALTVCRNPGEVAFLFSAWFLGAVSYRVLRAGLVPLPAGLLGTGLIIAGMAVQHLQGSMDLKTDTAIAAGAAIAMACRPLVMFDPAPRYFGWAAGFSYTLYAIHLPLVFLIHSIFQSIGFPTDDVPPGPVAFMEFGVTFPICLLTAYLISRVTERKTGQVRAAMLRMCPPRPDRRVSDRG
jgi:peptidoglycan/LPS O-acetylase OafA/YrhL